VARRLEDVQRAVDVVRVGAQRIGDRARHRAHGGLVEDHLDAGGGPGDRVEIADVALVHLEGAAVSGAEGEVVTGAGREVVEDADAVTVGEQALGDVRPDEPRAAGDEHETFHRTIVAYAGGGTAASATASTQRASASARLVIAPRRPLDGSRA
jgi:hypothetical protein